MTRRARPKFAAPKARQWKDEGDGYSTLHPTQGWRRFTARRINAIKITEAKRNGILPWWAGVRALDQRAAQENAA